MSQAVIYIPRLFGGTLILRQPSPGIAALSDTMPNTAALLDQRIDRASASDMSLSTAALTDRYIDRASASDMSPSQVILSDQG